MLNDKKYYEIAGRLAILTDESPKIFDYERIEKIRRLAARHKRACELQCNGSGYLRGFGFTDRADLIEREVAYCEEKIIQIAGIKAVYKVPFEVETQRDPRGATVKLFYVNKDGKKINVTDILY